jgi:hypothetical protein
MHLNLYLGSKFPITGPQQLLLQQLPKPSSFSPFPSTFSSYFSAYWFH